MATDDAVVVRGLLGWSNGRAGLEVYRYDPDVIPRFKTGRPEGDLLVYEGELQPPGRFEGATVLVAVLPRGWSDSDIAAVEKALEDSIGQAQQHRPSERRG